MPVALQELVAQPDRAAQAAAEPVAQERQAAAEPAVDGWRRTKKSGAWKIAAMHFSNLAAK